jgi:hypothetical protein
MGSLGGAPSQGTQLDKPQAMPPRQTTAPAVGAGNTIAPASAASEDDWQPPKRMSSGVILAIAGAILAVGGISAYFLLRPKAKAKTDQTEVADKGAKPSDNAGAPATPAGGMQPALTAKPDAAVAAKVPDEPKPPPGPVRHKITIESEPAGATVKQGLKELGKTPYSFDVDDGKAAIKYTLAMKGYKDTPLDVVPDSDGKYVVPLSKSATGGHRGGHGGDSGGTGNKDLKDPFGNH